MTEPQATVDRLGLTLKAEFVPFSQSRNRGNKERSLNWRVTIEQNGKPVLSTDYSAGIAHCPSYGTKAPINYPNHVSHWQANTVAWECEYGRPAAWPAFTVGNFSPKAKTATIQPETLDVLASLVMDSSVLDESSFEDWASSLGYATDSRKAETIYRACMATALQLRNRLGEKALEDLRNAFQDY